MTIFSGQASNTSGVSVQFCNTGYYNFKTATFFGFKNLSGGSGNSNSGPVWLGPSSGLQPFLVSAGSAFTYPAPEAIQNLFFVGQSGDALFAVTYQ